MEIVGDRRFVEIPGDKTHELPPLLVQVTTPVKRLARAVEMASAIVESEDLIAPQPLDALLPEKELERRKMDLAVNLVEQYVSFLTTWQWGHSILEWIRQCEITFDSKAELRPLLRADVWPHAGRSSFVTLLEDKGVATEGISIERAVGLRLTFRHPPAISCFSDQFLLYLNSSIAASAYQTWAHMTPEPISSLPPERFHFEVVSMTGP